MRTKQDQLYGEILKRQIVTFDEIVEFMQQMHPHLKPKVINDVFLANLIKQEKIKHIRRELYQGIPLYQTNDDVLQFDKFTVVAKFRKGEGIVTYHGALELYGCAYNSFSEILIGVKSYFHPFKVGSINYKPTYLPNPELGIETFKLEKDVIVRVSSRERTFIDCLNRIDYIGGWEECLKSLESLGGIDYYTLLELMKAFQDKQLLLRKIGFILEVFQEHSVYYEALSNQMLNEIENLLSPSKLYIDRTLRLEENVLFPRWKLYVPLDFIERNLRGV